MRETCLQVSGKTTGLLGFGHIARALARRPERFDVRILHFELNRASTEVEIAFKVKHQSPDKILRDSDSVSLHIPVNASTKKMVSADFVEKMKEGAILINTVRRGIVDGAALADALKRGKLRGAGLDVFEQEPPAADYPLLGMEQVVANSPY